MRRVELTVDVGRAVDSDEPVAVAVTVVLPDDLDAGRPPVVLFGFPGGGYGRRYYDLALGDADGYSQAAYHAGRGGIFVAVDHVGAGDSDVPPRPVDLDAVARADAAAARAVLAHLAGDSADSALPTTPVAAAVAMGQSFGGFLLTIAQAQDPVFDGVALLGWSGVRTRRPWADDVDMDAVIARGVSAVDNPRRAMFHYDDVPGDMVEADLTRTPGRVGPAAPWGSAHYPGGPDAIANRDLLAPGTVAEEAAAITVPVMVVSGERDVIADLHAEPAAYRASPLVTIHRLARSGHMHNFASTRRHAWARLHEWSLTCAAMRQER